MDRITITRDGSGKISSEVKVISTEAAAGLLGVAALKLAADTFEQTGEMLVEAKKRLARLVLLNMNLKPEDLL